jgi:tRNA threonylcarbamoyl adenosine modification protein YeaZ
MLILALDTSSPIGSIAVLRDEQVVGLVSTGTDENFSSRFFRQLKFLMGELRVKPADFNLFAVTAGPGSFTGLRVGLTAAKGWSEVYARPIAAVSALEATAVQSQSRAARVAAVLDARRGQAFFATYRRASDGAGLVPEGDERLVTPEELRAALRETPSASGCEVITAARREELSATKDVAELVIVTPVPRMVAAMLSDTEFSEGNSELRIHVEEASPILAPFVGRLGFHRAQQGLVSDALSLDANYIRRSDAELHLTNSTTTSSTSSNHTAASSTLKNSALKGAAGS